MAVSPEHLNQLFGHCLGASGRMLQNFGSFNPFGASLRADGQIAGVSAAPADQHPGAQAIIQSLVDGLSEGVKAGEVLAVAVVANVDMPEKLKSPIPDGVRIHLESADFSRVIYVAYSLVANDDDGGGEKVVFSDPVLVEVPHQFFK